MARGNRWGTRKLRKGEIDTSPALPKWLQTVYNALDIRDVVGKSIVNKSRIVQGNVGNLPIFSSEGLRQAESNIGMLFNQVRKREGASLDYYTSSTTTYTIAAGATKRGISLLDISSEVTAESGEEGLVPEFLAHECHLVAHSTAPFTLHPFVITLENGETLSAVDYNGTDPVAAILAMKSAGDYVLTMGPVSQAYQNDACTFFKGKVDLGWEILSNFFTAHYSKSELHETNPLKMYMGLIIGGQPSQQVILTGGYYRLFYQKPRSWGDVPG